MDKAKNVGEKILVGKTARVSGLMYAVGVGWQSTKLATINGAVGYAWGTQRTGLLNPASVHHVTLEPVVHTVTDELAPNLDAALMIGHSWRALLHVGISAGLNTRITPDIAAGPLVKLRAGYGEYGLYLYGGTLSGASTEVVAGIGIELYRLPSMPLVERAKRLLSAGR